MAINKGYLTAKTNKASDEVFTPEYAIKPLIKYIKPNINNAFEKAAVKKYKNEKLG